MGRTANLAGHPIHSMLIPFPIALWLFSVLADLIYLWRGNTGWEWMASWTLLAGSLGAIMAAVFGIIDYFSITDKKVSNVAAWHARFNVLALLLFATSWYLRRGVDFANPNGKLTVPIALSIVGVVVVSISGWLGGELVFRHGVGVHKEIGSTTDEV